MNTRSFIKSLALLSGAAVGCPGIFIAECSYSIECLYTIDRAFDVETANRLLRDGWKFLGATSHMTANGVGEKLIYIMGKPLK